MIKRQWHQVSGISLIESMLAVMILQVAVLGMIYTVNAGHAHLDSGGNIVEASRLAEELMEEILTKEYTEPDGDLLLGPDTGEASRGDFDDIDDYANLTEAQENIYKFDGTLHDASLQKYSRSVGVTSSSMTVDDLGTTVNGKLVVVTVSISDGRQYQLSRFVRERS